MKSKLPYSFIIFVVVPIVAAVLYYAFFASKQYVVETKYIIQKHQQTQSEMLGLFAGFAGMSSSASTKDSYIAKEYIWSAELLDKLDKELKIKSHYSDRQYDWWARLPVDAPFSDYLRYWQDAIEIEYDSVSGITTLGVTAFTPEQSLLIAQRILKEAEEHVNRLSERSRKDALNFSKNELKDAESMLIQARADITKFRNTQKDINPEKTTEARLGLATEIESKLTDAQTELSNLAAFMKPSAFKIRSLRNKVSTLRRQLHSERESWGDTGNINTLSVKIAGYEQLLAKKIIAEKLYESALSSLEAARLTVIQQQQYLEVITAPYKPSEAEKPYVLSNMISVVLGSFMLWAIGTLIISAVKDHA